MTDAPIILIVEDDAGARRALGELLEADGFVVREAATLAAAREASAEPDVSAILLDLRLPDGNGQELLVERGAGRVPIIVMTAFGSGSRAIEAMRAGAYDYVQKPLDPDEIGPTLRRALDHARLTSELARAQRHVDAPIAATERIVGTSTALQRVFKLIGRVAQSDATVLISGESGTGKELVASVIHAYSARASGPFVAINCAAVPEALLESEFFGYEKGAFTNAMVQRIGRFEAAAGSTLFLDEIGELPLAMQAKLLRFIQEPRSSGSAETSRSRSTRASSRHPTAISMRKSRRAGFVRICTIGSASLKSRCRRCAIGSTTSPPSSITFSPGRCVDRASASRSPRRRCGNWPCGRGAETSASSRTPSSARSCSRAGRSISRTWLRSTSMSARIERSSRRSNARRSMRTIWISQRASASPPRSSRDAAKSWGDELSESLSVKISNGAQLIGSRARRKTRGDTFRRIRRRACFTCCGFALKLAFSQAVSAPPVLGRYAHFRLGQFVPVASENAR